MRGAEIPSEVTPGVSYRLERPLGFGGLFASFLALRCAAGGTVTVVMKLLRPSIVRKLGEQASLVVRKEAVALGRLNERVPPTPFVVRLIDAGAVVVEQEGRSLELPWTVVEYVSGGLSGTTLALRVRRSIERRGRAFSPARAANAIECIAQGLGAAHEVGVIHRDLAPQAILCSGSGSFELFKITDFGGARAEGLRATLGTWVIGTPGYVAPEHAGLVPGAVGSWTDVFGFAAIIYYMLTGERLHVDQPGESELRTLLDGSGLAPELRARPAACRAIDQLLAWASSKAPEQRLAEPLALAAMVQAHLCPTGEPATRVSVLPAAPGTVEELWSWSWLHQPEDNPVIRSVSWDGYGRALAATSRGLWLWDGTIWRRAVIDGLEPALEVDFVARVSAGRWMLGCRDGTLAVCTVGGVTRRLRAPTPASRYLGWSGALDDVGVLLTATEGVPSLHALVGKRWLKPLALADASVSGICRVDDAEWLVMGRTGTSGYAAVYAPLGWEIARIPTPNVRAFIACDGAPSRRVAVAAALEGALLWRDGAETVHECIDGGFDVSAAAVDPAGRGWVAGAGRIWAREPGGTWRLMWSDPERELPIVSISCDLDRVDAIFADGGVVAGRVEASE